MKPDPFCTAPVPRDIANLEVRKAAREIQSQFGFDYPFTCPPLVEPGIRVLGISSCVIGISGKPNYHGNAQSGDFSTVTVTLVPIIVLFSTKGEAEKLNLGGEVVDGPSSVFQHELWHVDGIPADLQAKVKEKLNGQDPRYVVGFVGGFHRAMTKIGSALGAHNTGSLQAIALLYKDLVTEVAINGVNWTYEGGLWHVAPPTLPNVSYDVHIQ